MVCIEKEQRLYYNAAISLLTPGCGEETINCNAHYFMILFHICDKMLIQTKSSRIKFIVLLVQYLLPHQQHCLLISFLKI